MEVDTTLKNYELQKVPVRLVKMGRRIFRYYANDEEAYPAPNGENSYSFPLPWQYWDDIVDGLDDNFNTISHSRLLLNETCAKFIKEESLEDENVFLDPENPGYLIFSHQDVYDGIHIFKESTLEKKVSKYEEVVFIDKDDISTFPPLNHGFCYRIYMYEKQVNVRFIEDSMAMEAFVNSYSGKSAWCLTPDPLLKLNQE